MLLWGLAGLVAAGASCRGSFGNLLGEDEPIGKVPAEIDPGPTDLRRLSQLEFKNTVEHILGADASIALGAIPKDDPSTGFDNAAVSQTISSLHASGYYLAARDLSEQVIGSPELRDALVGCDPNGSDKAACLDAFVTRFGRRMFRRPLLAEEKEGLLALAAMDADGWDGVARVIEAALQSPSFLWRAEVGAPEPSIGIARLDGFEIATRLSFFLLGRGPDDGLLDAAAAGELDSDEGIAGHVRSLLATPEVREGLHHFTAQWFGIARLPDVVRDPALFPEFDDALVAAMGAELSRLLDDHLYGEGASFLDVYTARYGYVTPELAALYGVDPPAGDDLARVELDGVPDRGGLFTTAAFLTVSNRASWTSAVQRGVFIRKQFFCAPPASPPPNIPALAIGDGQDPEAAEELHMAEEPCKSCHAGIDPIGWGLERYDAIGKLRETYASGNPVKTEGEFVNIPGVEDQSFGGGLELGELAAGSEGAAACVAKQTFRYAMGRSEQSADLPALDTVSASFADAEHQFVELVVSLTTSHTFTTRRLEP